MAPPAHLAPYAPLVVSGLCWYYAAGGSNDAALLSATVIPWIKCFSNTITFSTNKTFLTVIICLANSFANITWSIFSTLWLIT